MKNFVLKICLLTLISTPIYIGAQNVPKYVLLEHFTNSRCGTCTANNPAFYNRVGSLFGANAHHITIHSQVPYSTCIFYQGNTSEQDARATFYGLQGTPSVSINGGALQSVSNVSVGVLQGEAAKLSPIGIQVTESLSGSNVNATIQVKTFGTVPAGTYKLYAAQVVKRVTLNPVPQNGEAVHYDVFRKWMVNDGVAFTAASVDNSVSISYTYPNETIWGSNDNYLVVFVQNTVTKEVLNSGNKFDAALPSATNDVANLNERILVYPNPATQDITLDFTDLNATAFSILNAQGQMIDNQLITSATKKISLANYTKGIYWVRVQTSEGIGNQSFVVQGN
jgi:Secretion system C-terminal sorting domain